MSILGVTISGDGIDVAVHAPDAEAIALCLFDARDHEIARHRLTDRIGPEHHGHIPGVTAGARYGLRAYGPWDPVNGHRFNPAKLLLDPYATAIDRPFRLHEKLFDRDGPLPDDTAALMPKAIAGMPPAPPVTNRPDFDWDRQVIYELHVRGFTMTHPDIPPAIRGTFAALGHPASIAYLTRLGVTTVELMPCTAKVDERHLPALNLTNYWGYNPMAMLAPEPALAPGGWPEIRAAVDALHAAGISVILDVVLNHTGESDELGPTLSMRGLDNAGYYRLAADKRLYVNDAGCGNILAMDRPAVVRLAMDSLRAWAVYGGFDGFRLDLAATLGRRDGGFDPEAPFLAAVEQDSVLSRLAVIAEPWDVGPGGYQLGAFPAGWGEWNDQFRDTVRRFWRGDAGKLGAFTTRFAGSSDIFSGRRRPLSRSVNYITAHDGFTLADMVAYQAKRNFANGEGNRDGTDDNISWNNGTEGPTDDPIVREARAADVRAMLATLLLSRGTPMLSMGDEAGRTQHGNNNAYAQDNASSWFDWAAADKTLIDFTATAIGVRRMLAPVITGGPLTGDIDADTALPDVTWLAPDGVSMTAGDWQRDDNRTLIAVLAATGPHSGKTLRAALVFHAGKGNLAVTLPGPRVGYIWRRALDASDAAVKPPPDRALSSAGTGAAFFPGQATSGESGQNKTIVAGDSAIVIADQAESGYQVSIAPRSVAVFLESAAPLPAIEPAQPDVGVESPGNGTVASDDAPPESSPARDRSTSVADSDVAHLAQAAGIEPIWWDVDGGYHQVSIATRRALLAAMRLPVGTADDLNDSTARLGRLRDAPLPPAVTVRTGAPISIQIGRPRPRWLTLLREDGSIDRFHTNDADLVLPPQPAGRHRLLNEDRPEHPCHLTVAPPRCYLPPALEAGERRFGIAAHLYSLRSNGDQGIGDFTTLRGLAAEAAKAGAAVIGLNPLHALFPHDRSRASPYHPSDRRFLDPIYIDVSALPGAPASGYRPDAAKAVDYAAVWTVKRAALQTAFQTVDLDATPEPLRRFATFEAIAAVLGTSDWPNWPHALRHPAAPAVAAFVRQHAERVQFHIFLQVLADRQLAAAAVSAASDGLSMGFYRDLAVGAAPDGAEAWSSQDLLMSGVSIGAPPDPFSAAGQVWCLPPPDPVAMRRDGYAGFNDLLVANMRHAGALRIDHVMGLRRLFVVPDGAGAFDGAYVNYPLEDLLGQVALQSQRARCLVVGEDLGTVPEGMSEALAANAILSYSVLWFERRDNRIKPPPEWRRLAAACVSTHDLPTLAGWWSSADIAEKQHLGLMDNAAAELARAARTAEKFALIAQLHEEDLLGEAVDPSGELPTALAEAVHAFVAATPAVLALVQADDLAGEIEAVNLPGTDKERPNWRRRLEPDVTELCRTPLARAILSAMKARADRL